MIICFDLSLSSTGVAVFRDDGICVKLLTIDTEKEKGHPLKLRKIEKEMRRIKKEYKPNLIIIEEGFTRFHKSTHAIYKCRGVAELIFYNVEQLFYNVKTIRRELLNNGNANKKEVQDFILKKYKKLTFNNMDESDAFAIGFFYFKTKGVIK